MILRVFSISILMALLSGCGSVRGPATKYYKLDLPPVPAAAGPTASAALQIAPFRSPSLLRQDRIVYRPSPVEVGFYEYHRWAELPNDTVTKALADELRRRQVFRSVDISDSEEKPGYILRGSIDRLQEVDYGGAVRVQASISAQLEDPADGRVIWSGSKSSECVVARSDVQAVVAAMGQASEQNISHLTADLAKFVRVSGLAGPGKVGTSTAARRP